MGSALTSLLEGFPRRGSTDSLRPTTEGELPKPSMSKERSSPTSARRRAATAADVKEGRAVAHLAAGKPLALKLLAVAEVGKQKGHRRPGRGGAGRQARLRRHLPPRHPPRRGQGCHPRHPAGRMNAEGAGRTANGRRNKSSHPLTKPTALGRAAFVSGRRGGVGVRETNDPQPPEQTGVAFRIIRLQVRLRRPRPAHAAPSPPTAPVALRCLDHPARGSASCTGRSCLSRNSLSGSMPAASWPHRRPEVIRGVRRRRRERPDLVRPADRSPPFTPAPANSAG